MGPECMHMITTGPGHVHHEVVSYDCSCCSGTLGGTNLYYYANNQYFIYGVVAEGGGGDWLRIGVYAPNGGAYHPMPTIAHVQTQIDTRQLHTIGFC